MGEPVSWTKNSLRIAAAARSLPLGLRTSISRVKAKAELLTEHRLVDGWNDGGGTPAKIAAFIAGPVCVVPLYGKRPKNSE
mmetsp:Transcript_67835/g.189981  ORF Transcript_67835/g.189981 Transcript_67835/m.189981 type:complete len:81 (-) Transcript_67835:173-415(-)